MVEIRIAFLEIRPHLHCDVTSITNGICTLDKPSTYRKVTKLEVLNAYVPFRPN